MAGAPAAAGEITVAMPGIVAAVIFAVAFIIDAGHTPQPTTVFLLASVSEQRVLVVEAVAGQCRITAGDAAVLDQCRAIIGYTAVPASLPGR